MLPRTGYATLRSRLNGISRGHTSGELCTTASKLLSLRSCISVPTRRLRSMNGSHAGCNLSLMSSRWHVVNRSDLPGSPSTTAQGKTKCLGSFSGRHRPGTLPSRLRRRMEAPRPPADLHADVPTERLPGCLTALAEPRERRESVPLALHARFARPRTTVTGPIPLLGPSTRGTSRSREPCSRRPSPEAILHRQREAA